MRVLYQLRSEFYEFEDRYSFNITYPLNVQTFDKLNIKTDSTSCYYFKGITFDN